MPCMVCLMARACLSRVRSLAFLVASVRTLVRSEDLCASVCVYVFRESLVKWLACVCGEQHVQCDRYDTHDKIGYSKY